MDQITNYVGIDMAKASFVTAFDETSQPIQGLIPEFMRVAPVSRVTVILANEATRY